MIRLVVADKNETMRLGMKTLFNLHATKFQVWEASDRSGLMSELLNNNCSLVIMEPLLFANSGEALIRQIKRESPHTSVLVYTELDELKLGVRAIQCGARGYLMKSSSAAELLAAADRVGSGKMHMSPALAEEVALSAWGDKPEAPHELLSDREKQVFFMLVCGWSVTRIAQRLNLSSKTISTHKARTMTKMRCKTLSELIEYAIAKGLKDDCETACKVW
jgi:two-component system invasion response regulator UvrY